MFAQKDVDAAFFVPSRRPDKGRRKTGQRDRPGQIDEHTCKCDDAEVQRPQYPRQNGEDDETCDVRNVLPDKKPQGSDRKLSLDARHLHYPAL